MHFLDQAESQFPSARTNKVFNRQDSGEAGHFGGCESCHFRTNF